MRCNCSVGIFHAVRLHYWITGKCMTLRVFMLALKYYLNFFILIGAIVYGNMVYPVFMNPTSSHMYQDYGAIAQ